MKILMVCLGNICRSPIAEGVLKHMTQQACLDWVVDSAGTNSFHVGQAPHKHSQAVCKSNGIDISNQRARRFSKSDLSKYDLIYAMASDVIDDMREIAGRGADFSKVRLFLNESRPGRNEPVPDPWYGNEDGYLPVYNLIVENCRVIMEKYGPEI